VKSAGTEEGARVKVSAKMILWADHILVMERKHKEKIQIKFPEETTDKEIIILDIPDEYKYMDKELIEELESALEEILDY
jgi:protein-tyrosine phosphatase